MARWKSSGNDDDHGANIDGDVLGCADEYAKPDFERDRCFPGPDDVEYGAVCSGVGYLKCLEVLRNGWPTRRPASAL